MIVSTSRALPSTVRMAFGVTAVIRSVTSSTWGRLNVG
jgi:hypothetical protein